MTLIPALKRQTQVIFKASLDYRQMNFGSGLSREKTSKKGKKQDLTSLQ